MAKSEYQESILAGYEQFYEKSLYGRRIRHHQLLPLLENLDGHDRFDVNVAGFSVEKRDIHIVKTGRGPVKVLMWSQMHGNESTATRAIFDLFNFVSRDDENNVTRSTILENLSIYCIPMLNPDGAEIHTRRNILDIDINRDSEQLYSPEARVLMEMVLSLRPNFGFNLHDQSRKYNVKGSSKSSAMSFLAPAFNFEKDMSVNREQAMQLICAITERIDPLIPGHIARYNDDFDPRAFGDNVQRAGTSAILFEAGGYPGDLEREYVRKVYFTALVEALYSIAVGTYEKYTLEDYWKIPLNDEKMYDLIIRGGTVKKKGILCPMDIAFNNDEYEDGSDYYVRSSIQDMGDLSVFTGYREIDATGYRVKAGKVFPEEFGSIYDIDPAKALSLIGSGYTGIRLGQPPSTEFVKVPLDVFTDNKMPDKITPEKNPGLVLEKDGEIKFAVVNGFLIDITGDNPEFKNALVI